MKYCFPPVVNVQTRLLILGSLPGEASLAAQQYYAHPRNQFWRLLSDVLSVDLVAKAYFERLAVLQAHGVGLWDIFAKASRVGSLDAAIRQKHHNDLCALFASLPQLACVAFNGQTAGTAATQLPRDLPYMILPSSSPAYTLSFDEKRTLWRRLRPFLLYALS